MATPHVGAEGAASLHLPRSSSFTQRLVERRIPQVLAAYLAGAWTFFQFVQWLVNRYVLSPHLVDLCLLVLLLMLPTVLILAYGRHDRQKKGRSRLHSIGIPCNILGVAALAFVLFGGKDLGSAQKTVTVTDGDGNAVERVIPKSAFRKRVLFFAFDAPTGGTDDPWLRHGVPELVATDLLQDLFITPLAAYRYDERLKKAGFTDGLGVPLALQRQIAETYRFDHVFSGTIEQAGPAYRLRTTLHKVSNGKLVADHTYEGATLFDLADAMSADLKRDLDIPKQHIEDTPDLPVSEVMTASLPALEAYVEGMLAQELRSDYPAATNRLDAAVAMDPSFAFAHMQRSNVYANQQRFQEALNAIQAAKQHEYRLPERYRLAANTSMFLLNRQPDEALQAAQQWAALYPDDTAALQNVAMLQGMRGETDEVVATRRRILDLDPTSHGEYLSIGSTLLQKGRTDEALEAYQTYINLNADDPQGYRGAANVYQKQGRLEHAREALQKALVVEPGDITTVLELAETQDRLGQFDDAQQSYERAIAQSQTPMEQYTAYRYLAGSYWLRGQVEAYITTMDQAFDLMSETVPEAQVMMARASAAHAYVELGRAEKARRVIAEARAHPSASQGVMPLNLDASEARVLAKLGPADDVPDRLARVADGFAAFGVTMNIGLDLALGEAYTTMGRHAEAAAAYEAFLADHPGQVGAMRKLGDVYAELGRTDEARVQFEEALKLSPSNPFTHLSLARLLLSEDKTGQARTHLDAALSVWSEADADFAPAQEARDLRGSLAA